MFALYLNPVTANAECYIPVAMADTFERLEQLLSDESCEPYSDGRYYRSFKEGMLHNFNPPQLNGQNCFGANEGIVEVISDEDLKRYHEEELAEWYSHFAYTERV
jgi:hypothetical protein